MTGLRPSLIMALLVAAALCVIAVQLHRVKAARLEHGSAAGALDQLHRDAERVLELRAKRDLVAWRERPTTDVLALVNAALIDAGIPADRLQGIGEGVDTAVASAQGSEPALRRQSLAISLERLTPAQIGRFLERWESVQDQWSSGRIELTHRRDQNNSELYDLRLHISAVYLART